ncbi:MAG TPA: hypothetical protein VD906_01650 [Caulobacteraceae bacterium]|nr:hypothetical protein [Caulobacteraceae bacterium]
MRTEHVDTDGRTSVRGDTVALTDQELRDSYERGRVDERSRHRRNWLTTILGTILSLVGIIVLVLAALNGSFHRAGAVIDRQLSIAADQAEPAMREAADEATDAIGSVGDNEAADPTVVQTPAGPQPAPNAAATTPEAR